MGIECGISDLKNITKLRFAPHASILISMNELDEFWSEKLAAAIASASESGRGDLADYLRLKATNDSVRQAAVEALFSAVIELALSDEHRSKNISIERESPHNFRHRNANMSGSLVRLRYGVRCLTVEAGWTRTPSDGFMRLGALAFARISHFGMPKANAELMLQNTDSGHVWIAVHNEMAAFNVQSEHIAEHLDLFTGVKAK